MRTKHDNNQLSFDFGSGVVIGNDGALQAGSTSGPKKRGRPPKQKVPEKKVPEKKITQPDKEKIEELEEEQDTAVSTQVPQSRIVGTLHKCPSCGAWIGEKKCGWCKPKGGRPKKE